MVHPRRRPRHTLKITMKTLSTLLFLALAAMAVADLPKPAPNVKYSELWTNSPFTTKPPPPENAPEVNPLEDYALGGIAPISGGYRITLLNRKNPEERIVIPDNPDFKILAVQYASGNPLETTVRLSTGSKTGTVAFDPKLLVLKAAPAAQQQQQQPQQQNMPPGTVPQPPVPGQQNGEAPRQPRPRVVPPAPAPNGAPQPAPQPQNMQQQQQRQNGQQRLNRR